MLIAAISLIIVTLTIAVIRLDARLRETKENAEYTRDAQIRVINQLRQENKEFLERNAVLEPYSKVADADAEVRRLHENALAIKQRASAEAEEIIGGYRYIFGSEWEIDKNGQPKVAKTFLGRRLWFKRCSQKAVLQALCTVHYRRVH